jgi:pimeloyl-ACP methyl ester carboxylesterase
MVDARRAPLVIATRSARVAAAAAALAGLAVVMQQARKVRAVWAPGVGTIHVGTLTARVIGEGPPAAVLLHGLGGSNRYWGAAYDALAGDGRLVVPDLLGFGRSPRPGRGYGPDAHADAVAACLVELCADRPLLVGAHSLGCVVALALAARHPHLVERIVGFGPPLYPDESTARDHIAHLGFLERQLAYDLAFAETSCHWVCNHRNAAAGLARLLQPGMPWPIVRDGVQHTWTSYSQTFRGVLLAVPGDSLLKRIDAPVTLVAGLADRIPDRAHLHHLADHHPNLRVVEHEGDHNLPLTHPGWCLAELRAPT